MTAHHVYWWGTRDWLNECDTQTLLGLMSAGAGATALCAAAVDVCAIAAAVLGIGAGVIQAIDGIGRNQGVFFSKPWVGGALWVWHQ